MNKNVYTNFYLLHFISVTDNDVQVNMVIDVCFLCYNKAVWHLNILWSSYQEDLAVLVFPESLSTEEQFHDHCWYRVSYLCGEIWWKCFGSSESFHKKRFPVRILMVDGYENKLYI